ncbi:MAG: ribosome assembly RNA-binding protein YhbY [Mariprofundus sp.]|nr:ribosome assembly RNA-binding protein YhbY [Mariprofundus sp.]
MTLSNQQRKTLKAKAHHLKPLIRIGQKGLTDNLIEEAIQTLDRHELVKVHIAQDDRQQRDDAAQELAKRCEATIVNQIGKTCVLYKKAIKTHA